MNGDPRQRPGGGEPPPLLGALAWLRGGGSVPGQNPLPVSGATAVLWIVASLGIGLLVWLWVAVTSIVKNPGIEGWLGGILGGLFTGLISVFITLLAPLFMLVGQRSRAAAVAALPAVDDSSFDPILAELEAVRQQTQREIAARQPLRIVIGAALGLIAGIIMYTHPTARHQSSIVMDLLGMPLLGGGAGWLHAMWGPSKTYARLYKERVLPKLAASFGGLGWRPAQAPLEEIRRYALFPEWSHAKSGASASAVDEIHGEYHGLPLSIMDLHLTIGAGDKSRSIFSGVLVTLTLPRGLHGVTVVTPGKDGVFGDVFGHRGPLQSVHLEDPDFARTYQVRATDQIAARALLTPAFMQRFMALRQQGFSEPAALAQDNRMMLALPNLGGNALFTPPSYRKPAAARETLAGMRGTIVAILQVVDAMLELDQSTRHAADSP